MVATLFQLKPIRLCINGEHLNSDRPAFHAWEMGYHRI